MNEYNLWRGFAVEPNPRGAAGCPKFLAHIRDNAARGVEEIYVYIISFFADMVQHPDAKPVVSMFFRGLAASAKRS